MAGIMKDSQNYSGSSVAITSSFDDNSATMLPTTILTHELKGITDELKETLDGQKENFESVTTLVKSKNIFNVGWNPNNGVNVAVDKNIGKLSTESGICTSDIFDVDLSKSNSITISIPSAVITGRCIAYCYDENEVPMVFSSNTCMLYYQSDYGSYPRTITFNTELYPNIAKIRIRFPGYTETTDTSQTQVEYGTVATNYEEWCLPYYKLDATKLYPDIYSGSLQKNPLYGKKLSVSGDSIMYGDAYKGGFAKIIGEENSMTVQNIAVCGGTIVQTDTRFNISSSVESLDEDADYILLEGGVNDAGNSNTLGTFSTKFYCPTTPTTFYSSLDYMFYKLMHRFAGKKYGFIITQQTISSFNNTTDGEYYVALVKSCEKWGVPYLDLNKLLPPLYQLGEADNVTLLYTKNGDGYHWNEDGYRKYVVPKVTNFLKSL